MTHLRWHELPKRDQRVCSRWRSILSERMQQQGSVVELAAVLRACSPGRQKPLWDSLPDMPLPLLCIAGSLDAKFVQAAAVMAASSSSRYVEEVRPASLTCTLCITVSVKACHLLCTMLSWCRKLGNIIDRTQDKSD